MFARVATLWHVSGVIRYFGSSTVAMGIPLVFTTGIPDAAASVPTFWIRSRQRSVCFVSIAGYCNSQFCAVNPCFSRSVRSSPRLRELRFVFDCLYYRAMQLNLPQRSGELAGTDFAFSLGIHSKAELAPRIPMAL